MFWPMLRGKMEDETMEDDKIEDKTMSLPAISNVLRLDAHLPIVPT